MDVLDRPTDEELRRKLGGLIDRTSRDGDQLDAGLRELEKSYERHVYKELIQLLASVTLERDEGARFWRQILTHQRDMQARIGTPVDVRVAMLDWLLETRALTEPRIVELATFEQLRASAHRDGLTNLYNFRFFAEHLCRETAKSERNHTPLSLAMIDVDNFKPYNDRHGHKAGNQALISVGQQLTSSLRQGDICARYGGEEFALVLSDTPKKDARDVAERARARVAEHGSVTISLGVATYPVDGDDIDTLVRNADKALYAAKASGKNQVRVYGDVTRSFRRVDTELTGRFRALEDGYEPLRTTSIGEGGLCVRVGRELPPGSLVEVSLSESDRGQELTATGRVVYLRPGRHGEFEAGLRFTEIESRDRAALERLLGRHVPRS